MKDKCTSLQEAIRRSGLRGGMRISFHHHLRGGDHVLNAVLDAVADAGIRDLTLNASALFDVHTPLLKHIRSGVITHVETGYISSGLGALLSAGILPHPIDFRSHGGRASAIDTGITPVDVAFIAAPAADPAGNATGRIGKSACGSLGYAMPDARHAKRTVLITDTLVPYPLADPSISETDTDFICEISSIGDPAGIVSGTTRITRDPVGLLIAGRAAEVIRASGLLKDGFSFQSGAGGATLAATAYVKEMMLADKVKGSFALGGITGYMVDMLEQGLFDALLDVQCFDLKAVESLRKNPAHQEISASRYASPAAKSACTDSLDAVLLGATEIDPSFNVNVHTDSRGRIMGGSGGHTDTAAGAKLAMILAPLFRARLPVIRDRVSCISTPGATVDVLVTQAGIAVNPARKDLAERLQEAKLPVKPIEELQQLAESITGKPGQTRRGKKAVARVIGRDETLLDTIYSVE